MLFIFIKLSLPFLYQQILLKNTILLLNTVNETFFRKCSKILWILLMLFLLYNRTLNLLEILNLSSFLLLISFHTCCVSMLIRKSGRFFFVGISIVFLIINVVIVIAETVSSCNSFLLFTRFKTKIFLRLSSILLSILTR